MDTVDRVMVFAMLSLVLILIAASLTVLAKLWGLL